MGRLCNAGTNSKQMLLTMLTSVQFSVDGYQLSKVNTHKRCTNLSLGFVLRQLHGEKEPM